MLKSEVEIILINVLIVGGFKTLTPLNVKSLADKIELFELSINVKLLLLELVFKIKELSLLIID
jgi:hypothetical protein